MKDVCVIVTCMGRLLHLQRTIETVLAEYQGKYCVVDYSCPDRTGDRLESAYPELVRQGRLLVARVPNERYFHKTRAWNVGARLAAEAQAEWLCFLDADTVVREGFWYWLKVNAIPGRFFIAGLTEDAKDVPPLMGVLVVRSADFQRVGGFDERFRGWGCEDIDLRVRLAELPDLQYERIPLSFFSFLEHRDELRSRFYETSNIRVSEAANSELFRENLRQRTGLEVEQLEGLPREVLPRRWLEQQAAARLAAQVAPEPVGRANSARAKGPLKIRSRWG